jgi:hypothetical protein
LNKAKPAERLQISLEIAKIKTEIYGQRHINQLKRTLNRLIAAKKKRTFPALEKKIANATAIHAAAKTHF